MVMRIGGLASGMDIDSIVSKLMEAERMPLARLYQKQTTLEWKRDSYREVNSLLNDLKNSIFDGISMEKNFLKKTIINTNENAVSVTNISSNTNITNQISITQLAKNASMYSQQGITADPNFDPDAAINTQTFTNAAFTTSAGTGSFTIQAIQADGTLGAAKTVTFDPTSDSLNDILSKISSDTDVSAAFDPQTKKITLSAKQTGDVGGTTTNDTANAEIVIGGTSADFFTNVLQFGTDGTGTAILSNTSAAANGTGQYGENAQFTLNGLQSYRFENTFTMNGYQYSLKNTTGATPATITSTTDVDGIVSMVKDFVTKYNDTIGKINDKLYEPKYRDYLPLSDEQKADMSDKQIEMWEDKAKSGLLRYDSTLSQGLNGLRTNSYDVVANIGTAYSQLKEIGIETSSNYYDHGKLVISDENKLRDTLTKDPMAVYNLFNKEVKDANNNLDYKQSGIASRLMATIDTTIDNIEAKAGNSLNTMQQYTIGRNLLDIGNNIRNYQSRLQDVESRYYRQFTAMEQAVQRANQQSLFLQQKFGG